MSAWPRVCLKDVSESVTYGYTDSATKDNIGPHFLRITDIVPDQIDWKAVPYCHADDKAYAKYRLSPGDIVVARTGATVGYAKLIREEVKSVFASYLVKIKVNTRLADPFFVGRVVESNLYKKYVMRNVNGAAQPNASAPILAGFEFSLPSLPVQHRIASILSDYDSAIANARKQIELLEEAAMRLYREWFDGVECEETIEGVVKEIESGSRPKGGAQNSGIPSIGAEKIDGVGRYDFSGEKFISEDFFAKMKRGVLRSEDILVYKDGAYCGKVSMSIDSFPHERAAVNEHVFILRAPKRTAFVYCFLRQEKTYRLLNMLAKKKAAQPGLNQDDMLGINVPFVDAEKAELFEGSVMPMMHRIATLGKQIRKLTEARDRLLPKLMSGEVAI